MGKGVGIDLSSINWDGKPHSYTITVTKEKGARLYIDGKRKRGAFVLVVASGH